MIKNKIKNSFHFIHPHCGNNLEITLACTKEHLLFHIYNDHIDGAESFAAIPLDKIDELQEFLNKITHND